MNCEFKHTSLFAAFQHWHITATSRTIVAASTHQPSRKDKFFQTLFQETNFSWKSPHPLITWYVFPRTQSTWFSADQPSHDLMLIDELNVMSTIFARQESDISRFTQMIAEDTFGTDSTRKIKNWAPAITILFTTMPSASNDLELQEQRSPEAWKFSIFFSTFWLRDANSFRWE